MVKRFLEAKHWQLFSLMIGAPLILYLVDKIGKLLILDHWIQFSIQFILLLFVLAIITFSIFFYWLWSIVLGLKDKVPVNATLSVKKFKIFVWTPTICVSSILSIMTIFINFLKVEITESFIERLTNVSLCALTISFFCLMYSIYFASKIIKSVELKSEVMFDDFIIEFVALSLFPIGLWFIQPKVNRLYGNKIEEIQDIGKPCNNN